MFRRKPNEGGRRPKAKPVRTLPDIGICRGQPSVLRGYFDCLVEDPGNCRHALNHTGGSLCLYPEGEAILAQTHGRPGGGLSKLALRPGRNLTGLTFRRAAMDDCRLLGRLNYQLIRDLGLPHRMTISELEKRMRAFLASAHRAIVFELGAKVVAYALYRESPNDIYLRQFLVVRGQRRQGIARRAVGMLRSQVWSKGKGLTVEVLLANKRALEFWRRVGYTEHSLRLEIPPLRKRNANGRTDK